MHIYRAGGSKQYHNTEQTKVVPRFKGMICLVKCAKSDLQKFTHLYTISVMLKLVLTHISKLKSYSTSIQQRDHQD